MSDREPMPDAMPSEIKENNVKKTSEGISRRNFLKGSGAMLAGGATAYIGRKLGLKHGETESLRSPEMLLAEPKALVLDFFEIDEFERKYLSNNFSQEISVEETLREMGIDDPTTMQGLLKGVPQNEEQATLLLIKLFKQQYQRHGEEVASVIDKMANYLGSNQESSNLNRVSIADAISLGEVSYDNFDNPTINAKISPGVVDSLISKSSEGVVNMSFELGEFSLTYLMKDMRFVYPEMSSQGPTMIRIEGQTFYRDFQGNNITKEEYEEICKKMAETEIILLNPKERKILFLDGYAGDKTDQNLQKLTELAKKYPKKMFIAAGGNPTYLYDLKMPDIREARSKLERQGLWPNNLLIVGFQARLSSDITRRASYGADIYVSDKDLENLGFFGASSYATPVVSEIVRRLISKGISLPDEIKDVFGQMTDVVKTWEGEEEIEYKLLNLKKAKDIISDKTE